jgi:hypothetical protein
LNSRYKGKISDIKIYNRFFNNISEMETNTNDLVLDYMFDGDNETDIEYTTEDIEIVENIIPFRREGSFYCLPHIDEGYVGGGWVKGETTARNEKRFVTEMQQGKINYKKDGINSLEYKIKGLSCDELVTMINVKGEIRWGWLWILFSEVDTSNDASTQRNDTLLSPPVPS